MDPETLLIVCGVAGVVGAVATWYAYSDIIQPIIDGPTFEMVLILWGGASTALAVFWLASSAL